MSKTLDTRDPVAAAVMYAYENGGTGKGSIKALFDEFSLLCSGRRVKAPSCLKSLKRVKK